MMKQKKSYFIRKEYLLPLLFTAVLSFGYLVTHETIGIDDTAIERYLEEGLEPHQFGQAVAAHTLSAA